LSVSVGFVGRVIYWCWYVGVPKKIISWPPHWTYWPWR